MKSSLYTVATQLEVLEKTPLGNARIEKLAEIQNPALNRILELALSPFIKFFVTEDTLPKAFEAIAWPGRDRDGADANYVRFTLLADRLASGEIKRGKAAFEAISAFLGGCHDLEQKWVLRVLAKDLKLGLDASSVNKAIPNLIFKESLPLAMPLRKMSEKDLKGRWAVQTKHDGMRCKATLPANGGEVRLTSRTGLPLTNYEAVREALNGLNRKTPAAYDRYLDGEVVSIVNGKVDFQAAQSTIGAKKSKKVIGQLKYLVFDGADEIDWFGQVLTYRERHEFVSDLLGTHRSPLYEVVETEGVLKDPTVEELLVKREDFIARGHEGFMIRKLDEPVEMKRAKVLVKVKLEEDDEFEVVDTFPGKGKWEGGIGGLVVKLHDGQLQNVGSGLKDEQVFADPKEFIGRKATIEFMEYTKDKKLRQPRLKGFRADEDMPASEQ